MMMRKYNAPPNRFAAYAKKYAETPYQRPQAKTPDATGIILQLLSDLDDLGNLGGVLLTAERGEVVSAECEFKEQGFVFLFF